MAGESSGLRPHEPEVCSNKVSNKLLSWFSSLMQLYLAFIGIVVPVYMPEVYLDLGEHKYYLYVIVTAVWLAVCGAVLAAAGLFGKRRPAAGVSGMPGRAAVGGPGAVHFRKALPALIYPAVTGLSVIFAMDRSAAFFGQYSWRNGYLGLLLYVGAGLMVRQNRRISGRWCSDGEAGDNFTFLYAGCAVVSALILLNRFGIWPIPGTGFRTDFVATTGNIDWTAGYLLIHLAAVSGTFVADGSEGNFYKFCEEKGKETTCRGKAAAGDLGRCREKTDKGFGEGKKATRSSHGRQSLQGRTVFQIVYLTLYTAAALVLGPHSVYIGLIVIWLFLIALCIDNRRARVRGIWYLILTGIVIETLDVAQLAIRRAGDPAALFYFRDNPSYYVVTRHVGLVVLGLGILLLVLSMRPGRIRSAGGLDIIVPVEKEVKGTNVQPDVNVQSDDWLACVQGEGGKAEENTDDRSACARGEVGKGDSPHCGRLTAVRLATLLVLCFVAGFLVCQITGIPVIPDDAGSGRGFIYRVTREAWSAMPAFRKLIGAGLNDYSSAVYGNARTAEELFEHYYDLNLMGAHSELLTQLVETGVLGAAAFLGMVVFYLKEKAGEWAAGGGCAAGCVCAVLTALAMNTVQFEHILTMPYFYLFLLW